MEATTDDEREARLHQFAEHVKTHIDKLSAKEYWKAATGTPEFVVLFIPAEALAAEALAQRPDPPLTSSSAARPSCSITGELRPYKNTLRKPWHGAMW